MLKKIKELKEDKLKELFKDSDKLKELTFEEMQDTALNWMYEKLNTIKDALISYSYGFCDYCTVEIKDDINKLVIDKYIETFSADNKILERVKNGEYSKELLNEIIESDIFAEIEWVNNAYNDDEKMFENFITYLIDLDRFCFENMYILDGELVEINSVN